MCGQKVSFNAASAPHEAISCVDAYIQHRGKDPSLIVVEARWEDRSERRVEVLAVQHQPGRSALDFVNIAVRRASPGVPRVALNNSGSILSNARAMATPPTMPETSAIVWCRTGLSPLAVQRRLWFIQ